MVDDFSFSARAAARTIDGHLASWARVCPGNDESAGKSTSY
jgi:hypothetical protein